MYFFTPPAFVPEVFKRLEYLVYDQRMSLSVDNKTIDSQVVIVDIDQYSQQKKGRWPWPRDITASLISKLVVDYQVTSVGLDIYFPDEVNCSRESDIVLQDVLERYSSSIVMAVKPLDKKLGTLEQRGDVAGQGVIFQVVNQFSPSVQYWGNAVDYSGNLGRFVAHEAAVGHILPITDIDAKVRRLMPLYRLGTKYFDALSLAMWRQTLAADGLKLDVTLDHWLDSPKFRLALQDQTMPFSLPVNDQGEVLIPYYAKVETVSAADILDEKISLDSLKGKFILVGSSAKAQGDDLVATPFNPELPGVEIHAVMLGAMLAQMDGVQRFKIQPTYEGVLQLLLMIVATACLLISRAFGVRAMLLVGPLLLVAWGGGNYWLWVGLNVALAFLPLAALILILLGYLGVADLVEINARHQHIRKLFGYYLPAPVVQRLVVNKAGVDWLKPERKELTILFADVQGFTVMAETLLPEEVAEITWRLFTELTTVIHKHQGTVDKYMGDAVMAFWGAPLEDDQHSLHAVQAACEILQVVQQLNDTVFNVRKIRIRMGIGINTGAMVVGNLGSEQRHAYTVMGATVNEASAIQQLTRHYPYDILAGEGTVQNLPESMWEKVGDVETRKLSHKVKIFALKCNVI